MSVVWQVLTRKKLLDTVSVEESQLGRVLNTWDLTALGVGSTLGVGVYVLAGHVAKETAGPAVVLSFLIASIASMFAGLCYAEFGARAPRAGSAYIYSYVCVGEFVAFVIGWNLILEYVIGSASVARGLSLYVDTLTNDTIKNAFISVAPLGHSTFISNYFDFLAFGISVILAIALAFGMKESTKVNNVFTLINLGVVAFVVIAGSTKADTKNWSLDAPQNKTEGTGGFFPFGVEGMIKGAATCFYGFVGFDCIATTGEEVRNPKRAIPISIIASLFIIFVAYFSTSTVITMMVPYYDQDPNAPIPSAFGSVGLHWATWVVAIGGIFGLCASLFGAMFPLPRIIYAMASDSLVFRFLGSVNSRFKTPVIGTLLAGLLTGLMAAFFELSQLVNMMSIGTLLAYTMVAASVLLLRYAEDGGSDELVQEHEVNSPRVWGQIFNCGRRTNPTELSEMIVKVEVCLYCVLCVFIGLCAMYLNDNIRRQEIWAIVLTSVVVCLAVLVVMSMVTQPQSRKELSFKVPLVPLIPALSILINIYLMLMLDPNTWIRFAVWMALGLPTYYFSIQKTPSEVRNESLSSYRYMANGKQIGFANHTYENNGFTKTTESPPAAVKKSATPPPPAPSFESSIAILDRVLEGADVERKLSVDSLSTASNMMREENVQADVHCADVPITPVIVRISDALLLKSSSPLPDVVDSPTVPITQLDDGGRPSSVATSDVSEADSGSNSPANNVTDESTVENNNFSVRSNNRPISLVAEDDKGQITNLVPPAPPPLPLTPPSPTTDAVATSLRPQFSIGTFTDVKLKHVDASKKTPHTNKLVNDSNENIKFNTPEYKEFREKLDKTLHESFVPPRHTFVSPRQVPEFVKTDNVSRDNLVLDNINKNDAKEKLAEFLARTQRYDFVRRQNGEQTEKERYTPEPRKKLFGSSRSLNNASNASGDDIRDDKELHRANMRNLLGSIRLLKTDSFKTNEKFGSSKSLNNASNVSGDDIRDDKELHRANMRNILGSIRLLKTDSFKTNEKKFGSSKSLNIVSNISGDNSQDDKELHRANMRNTLGSIQLLKKDSFKTDEMKVDADIQHKKTKDDSFLDRLQHKEKMSNIFRSIRVRKEDSFTNVDEKL